MTNKLIFLEFNEICINLIEPWMEEGKLPNFQALRDNAVFFNTTTDEDEPNLEPWIQWHSIHTGKSYKTHKVFELTDGTRCKHEHIWNALNNENLNVASIGSMNVKNFQGENCVYIPDPWCNSEKTHPQKLQATYDFISQSVQKHSKGNHANATSKLKQLSNLRSNGLRNKTILKIIKQLASEKINYSKHSWKRATLLDQLQFDLARKVIIEQQPNFISFFSNSVAHLQHAYWRYFQPEKFDKNIGKESYELYKDAIYYGYKKLDELLGMFIELANKHDYQISLCSALSQRAYTKYESAGGRHYYRLNDGLAFLQSLGLDTSNIELYPIMAHEYKLLVKDESQIDLFIDTLSQVKSSVDSSQVLEVFTKEKGVITFECQLYNQLDENFEIVHNGNKTSFYEYFYKMQDIKSGGHDPSGLLFLPQGYKYTKSKSDVVSILDITPTLMNILEIDSQNKFTHDCEGNSLIAC